MTTSLNLEQIEQKLKSEKARIHAKVAPQQPTSGVNPDRDDRAQSFAARERRLALQDVDQARLLQIEAALERIDDGSYGVCAHCEASIAPGRLEIIPYATLCIDCQQKQNQN